MPQPVSLPQISRQEALLVGGTLLFSRLLLYVTWDQLSLVSLKESVQNWLFEFWNSSSWVFLFSLRIWKNLLLHFFGTSEVSLSMDELIGRRLKCGNGTGTQLVGRVKIDFACLQVKGKDAMYQLLSQSAECFTCALQPQWNGNGNVSSSFQVGTRYPTLLKSDTLGNSSCSSSFHFEQMGLYQIDLDSCEVTVLKKPVNAFLPIFWAFVFLCVLAGARLAYHSIYKTAILRRFLVWFKLRFSRETEVVVGDAALLLEEVDASEMRKSKARVTSLDVFRGLAITVMIFVNYGGGSYYFFNHSIWNGLTVADLVFPWFMWIMGVSCVISIQSQLRKSIPRKKLVGRVVRRALTLILLGLVMNTDNNHNDLSKLRLPGVLQRFGLAYLAVGLLEALQLPRQFSAPPALMADLYSAPWQWLAAATCVALQTCLTFFLQVPGCPTGYLGPGGKADNGTHWNCTGGAARFIDVTVFGEEHIYQSPTSHHIYGGAAHDPEGLLGTLNSMALVWLGTAAGRILIMHQDWKARAIRWTVWACILGLAAGGLCGFSLNEGLIPINKNLWSLSFILATAAMAFFLLTLLYLLIDVYKFWSGAPLLYPGMNSILLYLGHEICSGMFPWSWRPYTQSHAELLAMNMWGCGLWVLTSYLLYRRRVFLAL